VPKQPLVLTPGDPDGIGPEITWKSLKLRKRKSPILCVGAETPFKKLKARIIKTSWDEIAAGETAPRLQKPYVWLLPAPESSSYFLPGYQAGWSIETATRLVQQGFASALVTGPISKERLNQGGFAYPGHTEFLASLCAEEGQKPREVTMMLANSKLRIALVTIHVGLKDVSLQLTREKIRRATLQTVDHLKKWFDIKKPRVALTALNPHAGENGLFGQEEIKIITPAILEMQKELGARAIIGGPFPADTFFANQLNLPLKKRFDAVVCMYHDQGLIPVKLLDFHHTVNVTLGLPIIRTSVDHGTGFDIAGQGIANPSSLLSAIELAEKLRSHL